MTVWASANGPIDKAILLGLINSLSDPGTTASASKGMFQIELSTNAKQLYTQGYIHGTHSSGIMIQIRVTNI